MKVYLNWTWILPLVLPLLSFAQVSADLKFAGWGQNCKLADPTGSDLPDPKEECDAGRGLSCQAYTQGKLCGCSSPLSYDRRSIECRRKVGTTCHISEDKEDLKRRTFNHKCHEDAECVIYSGTLIGEEKRNEKSKPVCLCKLGFVATKDMAECRDPNGSSVLKLALILIPLFSLSLWLL